MTRIVDLCLEKWQFSRRELYGEIFESKQLKISQPIPATQEKSQSKKSTPRNFEKKLYYIESEI